jgi:hypothetical protein
MAVEVGDAAGRIDQVGCQGRFSTSTTPARKALGISTSPSPARSRWPLAAPTHRQGVALEADAGVEDGEQRPQRRRRPALALGQAAAQLHRDHLGRGRAHPLQLLVDRDERALGRRGEEVPGVAVARLDGQQRRQLQARRLRLHPPQLWHGRQRPRLRRGAAAELASPQAVIVASGLAGLLAVKPLARPITANLQQEARRILPARPERSETTPWLVM